MLAFSVEPGRIEFNSARPYTEAIVMEEAPMQAVHVYGALVVLFILICIPLIKMTNDATKRHKQTLKHDR